MNEDINWIEKFFTDMEKSDKYKRPADYIERGLRILSKQRRNTVQNQYEGKKSGEEYE